MWFSNIHTINQTYNSRSYPTAVPENSDKLI
jgi:hypothetical protein